MGRASLVSPERPVAHVRQQLVYLSSGGITQAATCQYLQQSVHLISGDSGL